MSTVDEVTGRGVDTSPKVVDLGPNIRACRTERGISLRELARRVGISASALSQIEIGRMRPSVDTLYEIARQLGATPDEIFFGRREIVELVRPEGTSALVTSTAGLTTSAGVTFTQNGLDAHLGGVLEFVPQAAQQVVTLKGGESCRQIGGRSLPGVDCVRISYEPGAVSPGPDDFVRHAGHEFNYVMSGEIVVLVGGSRYHLSAGDSLTFPSDWLHRVLNPIDVQAEVLCLFVRGS